MVGELGAQCHRALQEGLDRETGVELNWNTRQLGELVKGRLVWKEAIKGMNLRRHTVCT